MYSCSSIFFYFLQLFFSDVCSTEVFIGSFQLGKFSQKLLIYVNNIYSLSLQSSKEPFSVFVSILIHLLEYQLY